MGQEVILGTTRNGCSSRENKALFRHLLTLLVKVITVSYLGTWKRMVGHSWFHGGDAVGLVVQLVQPFAGLALGFTIH